MIRSKALSYPYALNFLQHLSQGYLSEL